MYPKQFEILVQNLRKLPGVGWRSAEKLAFSLLEWRDSDLLALGKMIQELPKHLQFCSLCGCLCQGKCTFCDPDLRADHQLLVLATPKEVFSLESSGVYKGLYHVLGGMISPIDLKYGESLNLESLTKRIADLSNLKEIIIALDSTVDGDMTALYVKEAVERAAHSKDGAAPGVSRIAFGLPIGSSVENADYATLARAVSSRQFF